MFNDGDESDNGLYNKYTEVFTKKSKEELLKKAQISNVEGMMEIKNYKNNPVMLNLDEFAFLSQEMIQFLLKKDPSYLLGIFSPGMSLCFTITEPDPKNFVPKVSEPKLGSVVSADQNQLEI